MRAPKAHKRPLRTVLGPFFCVSYDKSSLKRAPMADARLKEDDGAEASGDGAFAVRVQGVESAWDIAGVTRETSARELKALLATASGIAQGSQRLIFQGAQLRLCTQRRGRW